MREESGDEGGVRKPMWHEKQHEVFLGGREGRGFHDEMRRYILAYV